ncbi:MAG: class I SAM-dependent methyltransferase [Fibromonadaceae bacterium]|nr:class I SAM-dependent methyltransferase [Fibromonadaceae bacterium]
MFKNKSISRWRLAEEMKLFASSVPSGALVLDAGSGSAPYRELFAHAKYESADFCKVDKRYEPSTYICDLANIPAESERYDFVILSQVMEHLSEPQKVLTELHRILKKGGIIFASAPLFWEEHEQPYDFFRYTQFAWKKLFAEAGFEIQKLDWLEGYYGTISHLFSLMNNLPKYKFLPIKIFNKFCSLLFYYLETKHKLKIGTPLHYFCIAVKP